MLVWKKYEASKVRGDFRLAWYTQGNKYCILWDVDLESGKSIRVLYYGIEELARGGKVSSLKWLAQEHCKGVLV